MKLAIYALLFALVTFGILGITNGQTITFTNFVTLSDPSAPAGTHTYVTAIDGSNIVGFNAIFTNSSGYSILNDQPWKQSSFVWDPSVFGSAVGFLYNGSTYTPLNASSGLPSFVGSASYPLGISGSNVVGFLGNVYRPSNFIFDGNKYTYFTNANSGYIFRSVSGSEVVGSQAGSINWVSHGLVYSNSNFTKLDAPESNAYSTSLSVVYGSYILGNYMYNNNYSSVTAQFIYDGSVFSNLAISGIPTGMSQNYIVGNTVSNGFIYNTNNSSSHVIKYPNADWTTITGISGTNIIGNFQTLSNGVYSLPVAFKATFSVDWSQTISLIDPIPNQIKGVPFTLSSPIASSGLPVTLSIQSGPAIIQSNTITPTGIGTVVVAANQAGNADWLPAPEITATFTVKMYSQGIASFKPIPTKLFPCAPFAISVPKATSGLPVTLSVVSGPATLKGNVLTITQAGVIVLSANQAGNSNYNAATQVTTGFSALPKTPNQTIAPFKKITNKTHGTSFTITVPKASSGLPVSVYVHTGNATINGNIVTLTGTGYVTLAADQGGNQYFNEAPTVFTTFFVQ
jgi:hypothetical protein